MHEPTVGSYGVVASYKRGTPVNVHLRLSVLYDSPNLARTEIGCSDLAQCCQLCGKAAEVSLGSDFTHTIVDLSISQLPVVVRKFTEPNQSCGGGAGELGALVQEHWFMIASPPPNPKPRGESLPQDSSPFRRV